MTTYPYVESWWKYGPRRAPALGLMYHMAEGGGTVGYLDDHGDSPPRGVSVHAVCEYSGRVVQMTTWANASGSLNPKDRSTDKAYYGHKHLEAVLGSWWEDPNSAVLSMEIEGFAAKGPNQAQVNAAIAWGLDMKRRYPSLRGALGHADQTDTKGCPGTTGAMKAVFVGVGGHGLWEDEVRFIGVLDGFLLPIVKGDKWTYTDGSTGGTFGSNTKVHVIGKIDAHSNNYLVRVGTAIPYGDGIKRPTLVRVASTRPLEAVPPPPPPPAPDCSVEVAAEHERTKQAAIAAVTAL